MTMVDSDHMPLSALRDCLFSPLHKSNKAGGDDVSGDHVLRILLPSKHTTQY